MQLSRRSSMAPVAVLGQLNQSTDSIPGGITLLHCKNKIVILTKKTLSVEIHYPNKHYYQNYVRLLSICVKLSSVVLIV